jgi:hypothetical protein
VKIIKKPDNKIRELSELEGETFIIKCQSIAGKEYEYRYKINNIEERLVEFIGT